MLNPGLWCFSQRGEEGTKNLQVCWTVAASRRKRTAIHESLQLDPDPVLTKSPMLCLTVSKSVAKTGTTSKILFMLNLLSTDIER